jgi:hypothetical protein
MMESRVKEEAEEEERRFSKHLTCAKVRQHQFFFPLSLQRRVARWRKESYHGLARGCLRQEALLKYSIVMLTYATGQAKSDNLGAGRHCQRHTH